MNLKLNANVGEGRMLAERYKINGVPQMVFLRSDGSEIDRIVGYRPPDQYVEIVKDIMAGKNTLSDLESRIKSSPTDLDLMVKLGEKYENMGDFEKTSEMYKKILQFNADSSSEDVNRARYFLAMDAFFKGDAAAIDRFILKFPFSKYVPDAYFEMSRYYASEDDTVKEVAVLKTYSDKFPDDPNALNAYAWRMSELEMNLEDALKKAERAVELSKDDELSMANLLDTQAEVLWKLGRNQEAIDVIDRAIAIDDKRPYFHEQRTKFSKK